MWAPQLSLSYLPQSPHTCTNMHLYMHVHTHIRMHAPMQAHTRMHMCTHTHSHTHNHQQELWPLSPMSPLWSPALQIPSRERGPLQSLRLPIHCYPGPSSPPSSPGTAIIIKSKADCFTPARNPHTIGRPNSPRIPQHTVKFRPAGPSHTLCVLYRKSSSPS